MGYFLEKAKVSDVDSFIEIIKERMNWMDYKDIDQWNHHDYLNMYPISYYIDMINNERMYVVKDMGKVIGGVVLYEYDDRWGERDKALYIHNLATNINYKGLGRFIINEIINMAKRENYQYVRLDCDESNIKLNKYYDSFGFIYKGSFKEGVYIGIRRELKL